MPFPVNLHTHSTFCDGTDDLASMVAAAVEAGLPALGLSSHAPLPFPAFWTMPVERLDEYFAAINALQEKYAGKIRLYRGLEIDYIPGYNGPRSELFRRHDLDYILGSVHYLGFKGDGLFPVDGPEEEWRQGLENRFGGDTRAAVEEYYGRVGRMAREEPPDLVGHLDVVKKHNAGMKYFDESAPWYRTAVTGALEHIARAGLVVEVNTGGLARKRSTALFPDDWIIGLCGDLGIRLTIASDAHRADQITALFDYASDVIKKQGVKEVYSWQDGEWFPVPVG